MRRITFLEKIAELDGSPHFRLALWVDVPLGRQPWFVKGPLPPGASLVSSIEDGTITAANEADLAAAKFVEIVIDRRFESGRTAASIQAELRNVLAQAQQDVNSWNPWVRYGAFFDDTGNTWTAGGVA